METTKGWCLWYVSLDYLKDALNTLIINNVQHIQVVNSGKEEHPFLIIYYNPT